ncbi:MAG: hypothetical protein Sapg2KO_33750 [Saprospiraceae bacterium]
MKKILLFLICLPQLLLAQVDFNYASPLKGAHYEALAVNYEGSMVAVGGDNHTCPWRLVDFFDNKGQLKWQNTSRVNRINPASDVLFNQSGYVVVTGINHPGAHLVPDANDSIYILALDTLGNTLFHRNFLMETGFHNKAFIIELADSSYILAATNQLFWIAADGSLLKEQNVEVDRIIGLSQSMPNNFMVLSADKAILFDKSGVELAAFEAGSKDFLDLQQVQDTTFILSEEKILAIFNTQVATTYPLPFILDEAQISTGINNQGIRIFYSQTLNTTSILAYQANQWDTIITQPQLGTKVTDFIVYNNQYHFVGHDQWGTSDNRLSGAYLSRTNPETIRPAIIEEDLSLESVIITPIGVVDTFDRHYDWINQDSLIAFGIAGEFRATFRVTNMGTNPINNFVAFSEALIRYNCAENRSFEHVEDVEIAVGETYEFSVSFRVSASFSAKEVFGGINICFSIAAPNSQIDQRNFNNHFCTTLLTNTRDIYSLHSQIKVFPNPAQSILQIELLSADPIQQIELFDLQGKAHTINTSIQGQSAQINRGNLAAGVYLLKVRTKAGLGTKKVLFN